MRSLKGQCHEMFDSCFFHESVSPQPQSIPFFSKIRGDIRKSSCTTSINDTNFASVVDTGGKFATSVNDTGGENLVTLSL